MPDANATALAALLEQMTKLTADMERQSKSLDGLNTKNRELLAENHALKNPKPGAPSPKQQGKAAAKPNRDPNRTVDRNGEAFDAYYTREDEDKLLAAMDEQDERRAKSKAADTATAKLPVHHISRADAANGTLYRAARAAAEAAGVPLQIVGDTPDYTPYGHGRDGPRPTLRTFDDRTSGLRWVRSDAMPNGRIRAAQVARAAGLTLRVFSTTDELDDGAREVYAEAGGE